MEMSSVQHWIGVAGLCCDFVGVLLLTKELPFMFGRRVVSWSARVNARNLRVANDIQARFEKTSRERVENKYKLFLDWAYRFSEWRLKARSGREAWAMKRQIAGREIDAGSLVDRKGLLDPVAVKRMASLVHEHFQELVENGEARDLAGTGLKWVLVGLVGQIIGSLPLGL